MKFERIITLSLNPAADITCYVDSLMPGHAHTVHSELYDAAGKAVDVSRVLQSYQIDNTALIVAGQENSRRYFERLRDENVSTRVIYTQGHIRENFSLVTPDGAVTRLLREGPRLDRKALAQLEAALAEEVDASTLVVFAGSMPKGMTDDIFRDLCTLIREQGAQIALDTTAATMQNLPAIRPWVIKPNYDELCQLVGHKLSGLNEIVQAAKQVCQAGAGQALVSLGADGLLYTNGEIVYKVEVPEVSDIKSTVGAGDATLAGFIVANHYHYDLMRSVRFAAAFGTASCLVEGTNPPRKISVALVFEQISVSECSYML